MIVVLDTNVLVSALLSASGPPAEIIRRWEGGDFEVIVSPRMLAELDRALGYPQVSKNLRHTPEQRNAFIRSYAAAATLVEPQTDLDVIQDDPGDNKILECAVEGERGLHRQRRPAPARPEGIPGHRDPAADRFSYPSEFGVEGWGAPLHPGSLPCRDGHPSPGIGRDETFFAGVRATRTYG